METLANLLADIDEMTGFSEQLATIKKLNRIEAKRRTAEKKAQQTAFVNKLVDGQNFEIEVVYQISENGDRISNQYDLFPVEGVENAMMLFNHYHESAFDKNLVQLNPTCIFRFTTNRASRYKQ